MKKILIVILLIVIGLLAYLGNKNKVDSQKKIEADAQDARIKASAIEANKISDEELKQIERSYIEKIRYNPSPDPNAPGAVKPPEAGSNNSGN